MRLLRAKRLRPARGRTPGAGGFGAEVREAVDWRVDYLIEEGLARR